MEFQIVDCEGTSYNKSHSRIWNQQQTSEKNVYR